MREVRSLTSLRALAALLVFMFHYADHAGHAAAPALTPGHVLLALWHSGQLGVSIFFVLSGFLITRLYYDGITSGTLPLRHFYVKRIARIWPLFLLFAALHHGAAAFLGGRPGPSWWVTCTMSQGFFEDLRVHGLPTAWSLTVEESFYVLAPAIFLALGAIAPEGARHRAARLAGALALAVAALLLAGLGAHALVARAGGGFHGFMGSTRHVVHATLAGRFPEFTVGMGCAFVHRAGLVQRLRPGHASALALASLAAIAASAVWKDFMDHRDWGAPSYAGTALVVLATAMLILALTREEGWVSRALSAAPLEYAGRVSYGFYLIQESLLAVPLVALAGRAGRWRVPVLYLVMSATCALVHEFVERPARRWIVARFGGPAAQPARAR